MLVACWELLLGAGWKQPLVCRPCANLVWSLLVLNASDWCYKPMALPCHAARLNTQQLLPFAFCSKYPATGPDCKRAGCDLGITGNKVVWSDMVGSWCSKWKRSLFSANHQAPTPSNRPLPLALGGLFPPSLSLHVLRRLLKSSELWCFVT